MSDGQSWHGGCACGFVRYRADVRPTDPGYCHCQICRKTSGAPVVAFADVPVEAFHYIQGETALYRSSERGERRFCPRCGSTLEFRFTGGAVVEIAIATLDHAAEFAPLSHHWHGSRLPWFDTADSLPRHDREPD